MNENKIISANKVLAETVQRQKQTVSPTPLITQVIQRSVLSSRQPIYLGMWTQGFWDELTKTLHPEKLIELQNLIGKKVAIAHFYRGWEALDSEELVSELRTIRNNGWRPMISVNPYFFGKCQSNGKPLYRAIAEGNCDEFLHTVGRNLKTFDGTFFLRFAWEMNIQSIGWSIQKTGDTPEDFTAAWRHFHDIVASETATNVLWVFSPNTESAGSTAYDILYPGNAYVDWIALDGYNWGNTQSWSSWKTFREVFLSSYNHIVSLAPFKPFMIAEVNSTNVGGNKALWYKDMLEKQLINSFPRVKAVVFYNEDRTSQENVNWLIDVTPESLSAFARSIKNPIYISSF